MKLHLLLSHGLDGSLKSAFDLQHMSVRHSNFHMSLVLQQIEQNHTNCTLIGIRLCVGLEHGKSLIIVQHGKDDLEDDVEPDFKLNSRVLVAAVMIIKMR